MNLHFFTAPFHSLRSKTVTSYPQVSRTMAHLCPGVTVIRRFLCSQRAVLLDDGTPYTLKIFGTEAQIHFPHGNALHFHTDLPFPFFLFLADWLFFLCDFSIPHIAHKEKQVVLYSATSFSLCYNTNQKEGIPWNWHKKCSCWRQKR